LSVLIVSHVADGSGASRALLSLVRAATELQGKRLPITFAFLRSGALVDEYRSLGHVVVLDESSPEESVQVLARETESRVAFINTSSISEINVALVGLPLRQFTWIHEMPRTIEVHLGGARAIERIFKTSDRVFFLNTSAADDVMSHFAVTQRDKVGILPAGIGESTSFVRVDRRRNFVLGVGDQSLQKGFDLFCEVASVASSARLFGARRPPRFVWVGGEIDPSFSQWASSIPGRFKSAVEIHDRMQREDFLRTLGEASVLFVSSREDTRPLVALEALALGTPVIAYEGATELAAEFPITELSYGNTVRAATAILRAVRRSQRGQRRSARDLSGDQARHLNTRGAATFLRLFGEEVQ
jgi:glycosyltransferase involved in cell wall biosynthesis